jgi:hypothetical protein
MVKILNKLRHEGNIVKSIIYKTCWDPSFCPTGTSLEMKGSTVTIFPRPKSNHDIIVSDHRSVILGEGRQRNLYL